MYLSNLACLAIGVLIGALLENFNDMAYFS